MRLADNAYVSEGDPTVRFPIEGGILRAFVQHDARSGDVTVAMQDFYNRNPFPNYDEMESIGSLVEKSLARGFPELLNRAIAPHARVLEVGCGTGQLGNFLSIAGRFVLSVDMTWNSLQLGHGFKTANGLESVHFAQMNLFRLPLQPAMFDTVICTGVLHHTSDPYQGFQGLIPFVKPGGYIIVGLYNLFGRAQTRFRRFLSSFLGRRVERLDPYLAGTRMATEKRLAWYMDQYQNPHESLHTMDEVLGWFDNHSIDFVRAVPSTLFGGAIDTEYRRSLFDPESRGSKLDRIFSQCRQMFFDTEGGLFVIIGKRK
jgi:2-polyprenyl-3-methyl-5-hydroxy-6-metoxy-1,4-benzoquinol methylase